MKQKFISIINILNEQKAYCSNHKKNEATTFCKTCQIFSCLVDSCGHPHIFHDLHNLDRIFSQHISPILNKFIIKLDEFAFFCCKESSFSKNLRSLKNSVENSFKDEKHNIHILKEEIIYNVNRIYENFSDEIETYLTNFLRNVESLEKIFHEFKPINDFEVKFTLISDMLVKNKDNKESFIKEILNIKKEGVQNDQSTFKFEMEKLVSEYEKLCKEAQGYTSNNDSFDNVKIIKEISNKVKDLALISNELTINLNDNYLEVEKEKDFQNKQINLKSNKKKRKTILSVRKNFFDDLKFIDLDILYRDVVNSLNILKENPNQSFQISENDQTYQEIQFFFDKLSTLRTPIKFFEWDNDLSQSCEEYFKQNQLLSIQNTDLKDEMKKIIKLNYDYEIFNCVKFICEPNLESIVKKLCFDHFETVFGDYNLIGISSKPFQNFLLEFVVCLANFK